jgi:DNA-binding response OmpR family regulator
VPVIIMTAYLADCVDLGNQLRELGARDCIAKPFQNRKRELVKKIRKLLGKSNPTVDRPAKVSQPVTTTANRFEGGDLVFFDDRVELLGVKIITDRGTGQTMMVLDQLRRKDSRGRYVCRSGEDLARLIDAPGGANAVATFVHTLRTNITQRLRRQCGIEAEPEDVIAHNEQGYFLKDGIVTSDAGETTEAEAKAGPSSDDVAVRLNARQAWILSEVQRGGRLKRATVEKRFHVTSKTAQRDLGELARAGRIEFVRTGRAGYYRAVELQLAERA